MDEFTSGVDAIGLLQDPVRRRLYEYVAAQDHEVTRNEAAEAAGVQRTLAAFHLDKLADAGLLETASRRVSGRSGPGAGRPAKLYRRSGHEHEVALPPRDYRAAATLLAEVAEDARLDAELREAARRRGQELREAGENEQGFEGVSALLKRRGYEPRLEDADGDPVIRMRNCPFHTLAEGFPALVCGMNMALLEGLLEGAGDLCVQMDPRPGMCCTVVRPTKTNET